MDASTLKKIITASGEIEKIDQEINDIADFADEIAAGDYEKISVTLAISKPKKESRGIVDHDEPILLASFTVPEWYKKLREGIADEARLPDSQSYSRDITDTMALMMIGNVISELYARRKARIDRLEKLGVNFK